MHSFCELHIYIKGIYRDFISTPKILVTNIEFLTEYDTFGHTINICAFYSSEFRMFDLLLCLKRLILNKKAHVPFYSYSGKIKFVMHVIYAFKAAVYFCTRRAIPNALLKCATAACV